MRISTGRKEENEARVASDLGLYLESPFGQGCDISKFGFSKIPLLQWGEGKGVMGCWGGAAGTGEIVGVQQGQCNSG